MEYIPLSSSDIEKLLFNQIKIIRYPELKNYQNIDSLLSPYNQVIILYEEKLHSGHWVTLFLDDKKILHFFDSYGFYYPNDELNYIKEDFQYKNDMKSIYLIKLLTEKYMVDQNDIQYQSFDTNITTCGYWCILRLYLKNMSSQKFDRFVNDNSINDHTIAPFVYRMYDLYF